MIDKLDINYKAIKLREELNIKNNCFYFDIDDIARRINNLILVYYPTKELISGITIKMENSSLICVNSNMSLGRQRYSFGHELYHLYFDKDDTILSLNNENLNDEKEKIADLFSSFFFAPYETFRDEFNKIDNLDINKIIMLSQNFGLSYEAIINRLIDDNLISIKDSEKLKPKSLIKTVEKSEYIDGVLLYKPTRTQKVVGSYIDNAEYLYKKGFISIGKYHELLRKAYRSDLIK